MLMLDSPPNRRLARPGDDRMIMPRPRGEVPQEELLGRRAFALAPWIVVCGVALSLALSEYLRTRTGNVDWIVIGAALAVGGAAALLALVQDLPYGRRYRRALWVYVVGSMAVLVMLSVVAIHDVGIASVSFAGVCPLATYFGFVFPQRLRWLTLAALVAATVLVGLLNSATQLFDAVIVGWMVIAAWASGVLVAVGHTRVAKIARQLASFDRLTGSLNRRAFMEQLERAVGVGGADDGPVALVLLDLIGFRAINDPGDHAGDEMLQWVGSKMASVLPDAAELGRIGDDQFGVLLPGSPAAEAHETARAIRMELHERISVSVGVATSQTRDVDAPDLYRVADAALALAKAEPLGVHILVAGTIRGTRDGKPIIAPAGGHRPLSYAEIRATGKVPRLVEHGEMNNRLITRSLVVLAAAGVPVVLRGMLGDGHSIYAELVRYGGIPWVLWVLGQAVASHGRLDGQRSPFGLFIFVNALLAISIGIGVTALSTGGLTSPILAGMFLIVLSIAAINPAQRGLFGPSVVFAGWVGVAVLAPASTLWVVPWHLALFAGSYGLGWVGHRAMVQTVGYARSRSMVDDLTQLPNRAGFRRWAEEAFFVSATTTGTPFGVLSFRLTGLRGFNETHGHAAGDKLLCDIAALLTNRLPEHYVIGRTGAAEFTAAVGMSKARDAIWLADEIRAAIQDVVGVQVGYATCPEDGATVVRLWRVAEERVINGRVQAPGLSLPSRRALAAG